MKGISFLFPAFEAHILTERNYEISATRKKNLRWKLFKDFLDPFQNAAEEEEEEDLFQYTKPSPFLLFE